MGDDANSHPLPSRRSAIAESAAPIAHWSRSCARRFGARAVSARRSERSRADSRAPARGPGRRLDGLKITATSEHSWVELVRGVRDAIRRIVFEVNRFCSTEEFLDVRGGVDASARILESYSRAAEPGRGVIVEYSTPIATMPPVRTTRLISSATLRGVALAQRPAAYHGIE